MKIVNVIVGIIGILVALAVWWSNHATDQANELIKQGNVQFKQATALQNQALEKLQAVEAASFPDQAETIRKLANEGADLYVQAEKSFQEAAAKYQAAADTVVDTTVKEYFAMEQKSAAKLVELQDLFRSYLLIYADPSITDADTLKKKTSALDEQATKLSDEYQALTEAAKKYNEQHKDKLVDLK